MQMSWVGDSMSRLWCAANQGQLSILRKELDAGADIEDADELGRTPLIEAAKYGHLECVRELLRRGANPHQRAMLGKASDYTGNKQILALLTQYERGEGPIDTPVPRSTTGVQCNICNRPQNSQQKLMKCGRCRSVWYCGQEHQRQDWPQHKQYCTPPAVNQPTAATSNSNNSHSNVNRNNAKKRPPCKFFAQRRCRNGDSCAYLHSNPQPHYQQGSLDEDDDDYDGFSDDEMTEFGFSQQDLNTLLSYGVKPWEDDAYEFLDALEGDRAAYYDATSKQTIPCKFYARGNCRNGDSCPYMHG